MKIAYTLASGQGETNLLLADVAKRLAQSGLRLCGTVQVDSPCQDPNRCDMDVRLLPDGPTIRISQSLGSQSKGCRLDPDALERAVALAQRNLEAGADLLIVNKFGKHEADGRGFRDVIAEALVRDIPVIVGIGRLSAEAFHQFCPDSDHLAPDATSIIDWVMAACDSRALPATA